MKISKKEFYGSPQELIIWSLIIFGSPFIMTYGMKFMPLNLWASYYLLIILFIFGVVFTTIYRKKLMPWGNKIPAFMVMGIIGLSVVFTMLFWGSFLTINGVFDKSDAKDWQVIVTKRSIVGTGHYHYLNVKLIRDEKIMIDKIHVDTTTYNKKQVGTEFFIKIKSGFLNVPWVAGYDFS